MAAATSDDDDKWITEDLLRRAQDAKVITSDDAELVRKADLERKGVVAAGKELDMPKATASTKHTRILQTLRKFNERDEADREKDEAAPRVFGLLDKKKGLTEIVEETGYRPKIVEELQADYVRLKGKDLNLPSVPRRLAELEREVKKLLEHMDEWAMGFEYIVRREDFIPPHCPRCGKEMTLDDNTLFACVPCNYEWKSLQWERPGFSRPSFPDHFALAT